jgi:hypothetical protein
MEISKFDTLSWAKRLESSGYPAEQARALVKVVADTFIFTDGKLVATVEPEQEEMAEFALEQIEKAAYHQDDQK